MRILLFLGRKSFGKSTHLQSGNSYSILLASGLLHKIQFSFSRSLWNTIHCVWWSYYIIQFSSSDFKNVRNSNILLPFSFIYMLFNLYQALDKYYNKNYSISNSQHCTKNKVFALRPFLMKIMLENRLFYLCLAYFLRFIIFLFFLFFFLFLFWFVLFFIFGSSSTQLYVEHRAHTAHHSYYFCYNNSLRLYLYIGIYLTKTV